MLAVPTVEDSLLIATVYRMCLVEWALCVVSFSRGVKVECLEIHCLSGFAIFLSTDHHAMAPGWSRPAFTSLSQWSGTGMGVWWGTGSALASVMSGRCWCSHVLNVLDL